MKRKYLLNMKTVAYYSGVGGVEIKAIEYGINDYILCVSGAWYGSKQGHRVKIEYNRSGNPYFRLHGYRIPIDECLRCDI